MNLAGRETRRGRGIAAGVVRAAGVVSSLLVVLVAVALAVLAADRVPFSEHNVTDGDRFIGLVLAGWTLALTGAAWLIALVVAWRQRHLRTRWLAVPPALVVAGAAVVLVIGVVVPKGFDSSNSDLEALTVQARSHPPGWSENYGYESPRRVGHLDIRSVSHRPDGVVVISNADSSFFHVSGWAHSPQGPPALEPGVRSLEVEYLDEHWYAYSYVL